MNQTEPPISRTASFVRLRDSEVGELLGSDSCRALVAANGDEDAYCLDTVEERLGYGLELLDTRYTGTAELRSCFSEASCEEVRS